MRDARSTFGSFIDRFLAAKQLAPKSRRDYARYLHDFDVFTGEKRVEDALTLDNAKQWAEYLKSHGPSAARNGVAYLRSLAAWLNESRYLVGPGEASVLDRMLVPRVPVTSRRALTASELVGVWAVLLKRPRRERYRAIAYVRLLDATGLRRNEARQLLRSDVHLDTTGRGGWIAAAATASGTKERRHFDRKTAAAIREYIDDERPEYKGKVREPLFITEAGKPFTENGFGAWLARVAEEIERVTGAKWSSESMRETWGERANAPIRDEELRDRCLLLITAEGNHDLALPAAFQVLESRIRAASRAGSREFGAGLMRWAFDGDPARLALTDDKKAQTGALEMYRGLWAYYRNPTAHRVRDDLDRNEVLRVVSWIDHLLWLIDQSASSGNGG
jgi:integrase